MERSDARGRCYLELLVLLRGLLACHEGDSSPEASAARAWLELHCWGCAGDTGGRADLCEDCDGRDLRVRWATALRRREQFAERAR